MLTLTKGRPLAIIHGGEYDGEILHLDTGSKGGKESDEEFEFEECGCKDCGEECLDDPCCEECPLFYGGEEDEELGTEFKIRSGALVPLPNINEREVPYIAGPAGSGKSTYASSYVEQFKKIFPQKDFFLFSRLESDPVLDKLKPMRVLINQSLVDNPIDITKELTGGTIVVFDDINTIQDDKVKKAVMKLMADIMEVGRKLGIYIVITNHLVIPNEKKEARTIMNEMQSLTVFPRSGSAQQITYALKQYFGLSKSQIEKILSLPSRWVTIYKSYPMCVVYETGCYILQ